MDVPPKTKAEILALIEQMKEVNRVRIRSMEGMKRMVALLIKNPYVTPEEIEAIEAQIEENRQQHAELHEQIKELAELLSEFGID
ncbi:hypothetical protein [Lacipirellula sp.]|uniref:hypothetical protein n=1 Tax=Lacipirellula sp. TaxID=2691419 RepID=UPI003D104DCD